MPVCLAPWHSGQQHLLTSKNNSAPMHALTPAPLPPTACPPPPDLNDGIPGAIELLAKGSVHADFWDWW